MYLPRTGHLASSVPGAAVTGLKGRVWALLVAVVGRSEPYQSCASCSTRKGTFVPSVFPRMSPNQSPAR